LKKWLLRWKDGPEVKMADGVTNPASERAGPVTGTCINVDGGQSRSLI